MEKEGHVTQISCFRPVGALLLARVVPLIQDF